MVRRLTFIAATVVDLIHLSFLFANSLVTYFIYVYATTGRGEEMVYICIWGMIGVGFLQTAFGRCPLTMLSEWLRRRYDPGFEMKSGFVEHYAYAALGIRLTPLQVKMVIIGITGAPTVIFCAMYLMYVSTR